MSRLRLLCACSVAALLGFVPAARAADFDAQQLPIETGTVENAVAAADMNGDKVSDLNGDQKPDAVTANGSSISMVLKDAAGSGYTVTTIPMPANTTATGVAIGQLNGDTRADIAVLAGAQVIVESQAADGSFTPRWSRRSSSSCTGSPPAGSTSSPSRSPAPRRPRWRSVTSRATVSWTSPWPTPRPPLP